MSHNRLGACVLIMLASSVSGCMSQAKFVNYTEGTQPNGKPTGCVVAIPERTNSWPYYYEDEARQNAVAKLGGPVEEVKPDPNSRLAPAQTKTVDGKMLVTYRLKQPTDMNKTVGREQGRKPVAKPVMQAGGMQQPGQATVITPAGGIPRQDPPVPINAFPTGGNDPYPGQPQAPFVPSNAANR